MVRSFVKSLVRRSAALTGYKIVRLGAAETEVQDFIPLEETLYAANRAGLSVGDYIDSVLNNIPGATQDTIDSMAQLGVFATPVETVVEIGPGSGRYLDETIARGSPTRYEIYETASPWRDWLAANYPVIAQPTGGRTLGSTADRSADLVQAHKVFSTVTFAVTCAYWAEMARVAKPGGYVVFDIMTEACLDPETVEAWVESGADQGSYPTATPHAVAVDYFERRGFDLIGTFVVPLGVGRTEYFVFRRDRSG